MELSYKHIQRGIRDVSGVQTYIIEVASMTDGAGGTSYKRKAKK